MVVDAWDNRTTCPNCREIRVAQVVSTEVNPTYDDIEIIQKIAVIVSMSGLKRLLTIPFLVNCGILSLATDRMSTVSASVGYRSEHVLIHVDRLIAVRIGAWKREVLCIQALDNESRTKPSCSQQYKEQK